MTCLPLRVIIADDQPLIRSGFSMILSVEDSIELVAEVSNGREALEAVREHRPHVVLMDIQMPTMNGIEACRELTLLHPDIAVLVLTTFGTDENVYASLQAGAAGFLLKDTPGNALVDAIKVIAEGDALLSPSVTKRLIGTFAEQSDRFKNHPGLSDLTPRETEVLLKVAEGKSNAEAAADLFLSETTIKTHVGRVLTKLDVRDRVQAVIVAYEAGLVRPGQTGQSKHP